MIIKPLCGRMSLNQFAQISFSHECGRQSVSSACNHRSAEFVVHVLVNCAFVADKSDPREENTAADVRVISSGSSNGPAFNSTFTTVELHALESGSAPSWRKFTKSGVLA
mmetsp:Transcript_21991/g.55016  ORF Transcript_21991/g.55016 Transcript_21991/m.55016 type:complete len:110 (+) Transcript_21991:1913-2242(+)